jgi:hypothetical protein
VRTIANAELGLSLFQVTADRLFAKGERLGNVIGLSPRRDQTQDGEFSAGQTSA